MSTTEHESLSEGALTRTFHLPLKANQIIKKFHAMIMSIGIRHRGCGIALPFTGAILDKQNVHYTYDKFIFNDVFKQ